MKTNRWQYYNNVQTYIKRFRKQDELRLKTIKEYEKELKQMNKRKIGRPYIYTHTTILYILLLLIFFRFSLREVIGYVIYHNLLTKIPNFRTLSYRIRFLPIDSYQEEILSHVRNNRFIAISIDATGLSKNQINIWFEEKHKTKNKRSWMKLELVVDTYTKRVIYHNIYEGNKVNEGSYRRFKKTINNLIKKGYRIKVVYADALYNSYNNFQFLENKGILPVIKIKRRSVISLHDRYKGYLRNGKDLYARRLLHLSRDYYALEQYDWERYKSRYRYGNREVVESVISVMKRKYGDKLRFRRKDNVRKELDLRVYLYNLMRE